MLFEELTRDFRGILDRDNRGELDPASLLGQVRDTCTSAGRQLIESIKRDRLELPQPRFPWLRLQFGDDSSTRYCAYKCPDMESGGTLLDVGPDELVAQLCSVHAGIDLPLSEGALGLDPQCFLARHLFVEAVAEWLPLRLNMKVSYPRLSRWTVVSTSGESLELVSDWFPRNRIGSASRELARVGELVSKGDLEGVRVDHDDGYVTRQQLAQAHGMECDAFRKSPIYKGLPSPQRTLIRGQAGKRRWQNAWRCSCLERSISPSVLGKLQIIMKADKLRA